MDGPTPADISRGSTSNFKAQLIRCRTNNLEDQGSIDFVSSLAFFSGKDNKKGDEGSEISANTLLEMMARDH